MKKIELYSVGNRFNTNKCGYITIIDKLKDNRIIVMFDDGFKIEVFINAIRKGNIKNPYVKNTFGVGCFGEVSKDIPSSVISKVHTCWYNMLMRCYDNRIILKQPTYKNVSVCEAWFNFSNFLDFYIDNFPSHIENVKFELDKDLLQQGVENKIYSPNTCVFLPSRINTFLQIKRRNSSGFIGVSMDKRDGKWVAQTMNFDIAKKLWLGNFLTKEEASLSYQKARAEQSEKAKQYLRNLNYLPEDVIELIK